MTFIFLMCKYSKLDIEIDPPPPHPKRKEKPKTNNTAQNYTVQLHSVPLKKNILCNLFQGFPEADMMWWREHGDVFG